MILGKGLLTGFGFAPFLSFFSQILKFVHWLQLWSLEFYFAFDFEVIGRADLPEGGPETFCVTCKTEEVGDASWVP